MTTIMNKLKKFYKSVKGFYEKCFGRKYYIVIARNRFNLHEYCVGHIFSSFMDAATFGSELKYVTKGEMGLEVHSFRSRKYLDTYKYEEQ